MSFNRLTLFFGFIFLLLTKVTAQDPERFSEEVTAIEMKYDSLWNGKAETIVFTGSSSIRFWDNLQQIYPQEQIINSGFGGSHASDLLSYLKPLVLKYNPKKVFIYEGDNDIYERKSPRIIMKDIKHIVRDIRREFSKAEIVLISAKPSIVRWHLKGKYKKLNRKFKRLSQKVDYVEYADIWKVMLDGKRLNHKLFIEDGLHMNDKGYELWQQVITPYVK